MIVRQKGMYRIVTVEAYNGCFPITAYMVQRLDRRRFLPDKWVDVKGYSKYTRAKLLFDALID